MTSDYSYTSCKQPFNTQNVTTCIPVLTPQGPIQHLQVLMGRLIPLVSHKESTVPPTELEGSDT